MLDSIRTRIAKAIQPPAPKSKGFSLWPAFNPSASSLLGTDQVLGRSGLRYFFPGWIRDERLPELQGQQKYLVYQEMGDMNGYCAAVLNAFAMFLRRADWRVDPVVDVNKENGSADFLESCMSDMEHSWRTFMAITSRMVPQYGFAPFEIVYKRREGETDDVFTTSKHDDGRIGWQNLSIRAPATILHWVWDKTGPNESPRLRGLRQITPPDYPTNLFIPIEKIQLLRAEPGEENPEGRSVLRACFKPFVTIKYLEDARNVIIEHSGTGIPCATLPASVTDPYKKDENGDPVLDNEGNPIIDPFALQTLESVKEVLKRLRLSEQPYVIQPSQFDEKGNKLYDISFLTNNGGAMIGDINTTIHEEGLKILMSSMTEFLALGTNATGGGSFALSRDKTDNFTQAITAYLDAFQESINNQAVRRLFKLNPEFAGLEVLPRIVHTPIIPINIGDVSAVLSGFKAHGWDLTKEANSEDIKNAVLDAVGLPMAAKTEGAGSSGELDQPKNNESATEPTK